MHGDEGVAVVAHKHETSQHHECGDRHGRLAGCKDRRDTALPERRPDLRGKVVAEITERCEQYIGGNQQDKARRIGSEEGAAFGRGHWPAFGSRGDIARVRRRNALKAPN